MATQSPGYPRDGTFSLASPSLAGGWFSSLLCPARLQVCNGSKGVLLCNGTEDILLCDDTEGMSTKSVVGLGFTLAAPR